MNGKPGFHLRSRTAILLGVLLVLGVTSSRSRIAASTDQQPPAGAQTATDIAGSALSEIQALLAEKAARTPAQQKIDSGLLYEVKMARGEAIAAGITSLETGIARDNDSRVTVDVTAEVTDALIAQLSAMGATVVASSPAYGSVQLAVSTDLIERIAALPEVTFIQPKQEAMTSRWSPPAGRTEIPWIEAPRRRPRLDRAKLASLLETVAHDQEQQPNFAIGQGSKGSEGELTHRAFAARGTFNTTGAGLKIGVLSDGVRNLAVSQALGDLGSVTVIGNPAPCPVTSTCDEGTAMLEIVHDLAPGAQLYFASAFISLTDFAQKIRDLQTAGCSIIVDDVGYFVETPFQDGQTVATNTNGAVVIEAVKDVAALGVLYFSSASNSGNLNDGTSGTWEGDFLDGGAAAAPIPIAGRLHNFSTIATPQTSDVLTVASTTAPITLHWSDPLGASNNDYDMFRLNSTGTTVLAGSTNLQNGTQDPYEQITATGAAAGQRIVVVKANAAAARFLHVSTNRGRLLIATPGETHGHNSTTAAGSFGVAAVDAGTVTPNPFNGSNIVEVFSSDGPRRIFFTHTGVAFTPGNFSSTGGLLIQKPDFTAADGVSVTGAGSFPTPFFGTSAAAPHAAAIAALIKSANPALTPSQIRTALTSSAIDIEAPGVDRDSGAGIIMAFQALQSAGIAGTAFLADTIVTAVENPGNGNGAINVGEGATMNITLVNLGLVNATNVSAILTTSTPGIVVTLPGTSTYPDIPISGSGVNATPFRFTVASSAACPLTANFTLTLTYTGSGGAPKVLAIPVAIGPFVSLTTTLDATAPTAPLGVVVETNTQTGRMTRNGITATCLAPKAFPGIQTLAGSRRFDSYGLTTCAENTGGCATVRMSGTGALNLFTTAYTPTYFPTDVSVNYAADPGFSQDAAIPFSFSVPAGGGQTATVVVHEVDPGGGVPTTYSLTIGGLCGGACATPNQVPIARAKNVTVQVGGGGTAAADINNGSSDPDGDPLTITQSPPGPYPLGDTTVLLTVIDPKGATSQATGVVTVVVPPTVSLAPAVINFGAVLNGPSLSPLTPPQTVTITQSNPLPVSWTVSTSQPWISVSPTSGVGPAVLTLAIVNPPSPNNLPPTGLLTGTLTLNTTGAANSPTATVNLTMMANPQLTAPIGSVDTPANGQTGVTGSLGVTGWAIDDIGATTIEIWRAPFGAEANEVFIGFAAFVTGARPDIAAAFPTKPFFDRAGWGYLLLTNFLPNQGNGTFTLRVYAKDVDGNRVLIGAKTITCTNSTATAPFGAIDTPEQGGTTSGLLINFGWVLAAQPTASGRFIPTDGSTIRVFVDGIDRGIVDSYNNARPDIQALFPGYANTDGAVGVKFIDTTTFANGTHTIAWLAFDNLGAGAGIGSRFFTISNSSVVAGAVTEATLGVGAAPVIDARPAIAGDGASLDAVQRSTNGVSVRRGFDEHGPAEIVTPDHTGVRAIHVAALDRLVIDLGPAHDEAATYRGYLIDGDVLRSLPVGSRLDEHTGEFVWAPGLGFGGTHALVFVREVHGHQEQIRVSVTIDAR